MASESASVPEAPIFQGFNRSDWIDPSAARPLTSAPRRCSLSRTSLPDEALWGALWVANRCHLIVSAESTAPRHRPTPSKNLIFLQESEFTFSLDWLGSHGNRRA